MARCRGWQVAATAGGMQSGHPAAWWPTCVVVMPLACLRVLCLALQFPSPERYL